MAFASNNRSPLKRMPSIVTPKSSTDIDQRDVDLLMKYILQSAVQRPEVHEGIKVAYRFLNGKSVINALKLLPILTKFTAGGNDHPEQNRLDITRKETHTYYTEIGMKAQGKYAGNSYGYQSQGRRILDTEDFDSVERANLRAVCGFNQKSVCFFQTKSFVSFNDLFELTNCESKIAQTIEKQERANPKSGKKKDIKKINCYSLVSSIATKLTVNNDSKSYIAYIKVHLLSLKNFRNCENNMGTLTIDELISYYIEEIESVSEKSIKQTDFIKRIDQNVTENSFMTRMLVAPYTDVLKSQVIEDHLDLLQTYYFELKPSETGIINIVNNLHKGVDLFELYKYVGADIKIDNESKLNAPAGTFFILEAVGSSNAEIIEIANRENRYNGSAPLKLRMSEKTDVKFKVDINRETDIPAIYTPLQENGDFIDDEIGDNFTPAKRTKVNFNIESIDLDGTGGSNKKFILSQDHNSSLVTMAQDVRRAAKDPSLDYMDAMNLKKSFSNVTDDNSDKNSYNESNQQDDTEGDL